MLKKSEFGYFYTNCKKTEQGNETNVLDTLKPNLIFLHGSIRHWKNVDAENIRIEQLVEYNTDLLKLFNHFNCIIPIANSIFNWLDTSTFSKIDSFLCQQNFHINTHIMGFSDGATGAFKLIQFFPSYFSKAIFLNAFPQHQNFAKHIDRSKTAKIELVFVHTHGDNVTPFEFSYLDYQQQKVINKNVKFLLFKGKHQLKHYHHPHLSIIFDELQWPQASSSKKFKKPNLLAPKPRRSVLRKYGLEAIMETNIN